ncbi:MAG TPA: vitamin K epoxide reductase family protein, partial [Armatimonadota bacterium]|nr:vitamin K epoxide reductase family protein [Armatimonadota bacterium]
LREGAVMDRVRQSARALGRQVERDPLADAPPGWVYNPSSWAQRVPICLMALVGFCIAGALALYQLQLLPSIWEPFFGDGSRTILTGRVSHLLPVPDAALGAFGYLADAVFGLAGGPARWKRVPWVVILFAIAVIPFGLTSVTLFILQPTLYDRWCTLCLLSVAVSLAMVPYAWDEFVASWQWMRGRMDAGVSLWGALLGR